MRRLAWKVFAAQKLNRVFPGLRFSTGINSGKLSHDQAHLDSLEDLDLLHKFVTIRTYLEATNAATEIMSDASDRFSNPVRDTGMGMRLRPAKLPKSILSDCGLLLNRSRFIAASCTNCITRQNAGRC